MNPQKSPNQADSGLETYCASLRGEKLIISTVRNVQKGQVHMDTLVQEIISKLRNMQKTISQADALLIAKKLCESNGHAPAMRPAPPIISKNANIVRSDISEAIELDPSEFEVVVNPAIVNSAIVIEHAKRGFLNQVITQFKPLVERLKQKDINAENQKEFLSIFLILNANFITLEKDLEKAGTTWTVLRGNSSDDLTVIVTSLVSLCKKAFEIAQHLQESIKEKPQVANANSIRSIQPELIKLHEVLGIRLSPFGSDEMTTHSDGTLKLAQSNTSTRMSPIVAKPTSSRLPLPPNPLRKRRP